MAWRVRSASRHKRNPPLHNLYNLKPKERYNRKTKPPPSLRAGATAEPTVTTSRAPIRLNERSVAWVEVQVDEAVQMVEVAAKVSHV